MSERIALRTGEALVEPAQLRSAAEPQVIHFHQRGLDGSL
jgi:hypothetical protein